MNDTGTTAQGGAWAVEPPKKTGCGRKALRIALIVAAVGAAAAGAAVLLGKKIKDDFASKAGGLLGSPIHQQPVREVGDLISVPRSDNEGCAL